MIKDLGKHRYRFIVSVGSGDSRRRFTKTVEHHGGKRALQSLYDEFARECEQAKPQSDISVGDLMRSYIEHMKTMNRKATTVRGYEICLQRLQPSIERILAKDYSSYQLQKKIAEMSRNGLSAKTIKNTVGVLSAAYEYGIRLGMLESNPCKRVDLPKGKPRDVRILYRHEIQPFLDAISDVDINEKCAYMLALFMGLRRSEILGLHESDVDLVRGLLNVHNTRHRVDGRDFEADTKTVRSTRVLAIPEIVVMDMALLLKSHADFPHEKSDLLIWDGFGEGIGGQALSSRLTRLEKRNGLPHVTLHGLRHTYASLLHANGVDMANISAELGHSNLATTSNIYTHRFSDATNASRGIASSVDAFVTKTLSQNSDGGENEF